MEEQKPNEENASQPASPQTPESPVKSKSDQVQETVDRNLAERAARQKVTDEVIAKRKQTAALEAAAAVTSAEQRAEAVQGEDEAKIATAEILAEVKKKADARELREIEMHNAMMDAVKEVMAQTQAACDYLNDIIRLLTNIADKP